MGKRWGISFPAIIEGLGAERVMAEAADMGQSEFIVCSIIYANYRLIMPRHPRQIYQLEAGLTFYPANESFYQGCSIRPASTRDWAGRDLFAEAAEAASKRGIGLGAWISCFANSRVAAVYPEAAVQNLYGSRDRLFLCFNNPDVRLYCLAMMRDMASRYGLASVMLDKIPQAMLESRSFGGRIDPLLRLVGSLCFCEHCMAQAEHDGIDLEGVRTLALQVAEASRKVPQYVREALADELRGDMEAPLFLLEEPAIARVLQWRIECVVRFLREARQVLAQVRPGCKLAAALVPPVMVGHDLTAPRAWLGAQSYRAFAPVLDTLHAVIHWGKEAVAYDTRRARDAVTAAGAACELCVHLAAYGARRPDELAGLAAAALEQGADSLCFFCHDLLDESMMAAIRSLP